MESDIFTAQSLGADTVAIGALDSNGGLDFEKFANAAHRHGVPLIVDNTFPIMTSGVPSVSTST